MLHNNTTVLYFCGAISTKVKNMAHLYNMGKTEYLGCRSNQAEVDEFRALAAQLANLKLVGRVTVSDILRRCIHYGKPFVEREAAGEVIDGAIGMTQYQQSIALAGKAVLLGLEQMKTTIPSSSSSSQSTH